MRSLPSLLITLPLVAGCAGPRPAEPATPAWDPADMDLSVDPGQDFYRYANGGWLDRHPVPAEYGAYGAGHEIHERNQRILRSILEEAAARTDAPPGSPDRLLGDFWASGMDEAGIEARGVEPLRPLLARIDAAGDAAGLQEAVAALARHGILAPIGIEAEADTRDSSMMSAYLSVAGLGLPEKDYYLRQDEESVALRDHYRRHVGRMLELLGAPAAEAAAQAEAILALETRLAEKSLGAVEMRDPAVLDDVRPLAEIDALLPTFDLAGWFRALGLEPPATIHLVGPESFAELGAALTDVPLATWRAWLRWQLVHALAPYLPAAYVDENFAFFGRELSGRRELPPRWKRVLAAADDSLGELLGRAYVERAFSPRAKKLAQSMVADLLWAMEQRLRASDWMSEATREQALAKLAAFGTKIGYPDEWRNYDGLELDRSSFAGNVLRAAAFDTAWRLGRIGRPVDEDEWSMNPQVVNAYYHPIHNEIVFPAGILQPPFFSEHNDPALNYGSMGAIIGHEITHGFDDSGAQFDAAGLLRNWWQPADLEEFQRRADRLAAQYDAFEALPGLHVNGRLTLGENIADQGGLLIAYAALEKRLDELGPDARRPIDGFTPEQRFFLAFARSWRQNAREEYLKLIVQTDAHAPARFRCLGVVRNLPEFAAAFGLEPGSVPMSLAPEERALVW